MAEKTNEVSESTLTAEDSNDDLLLSYSQYSELAGASLTNSWKISNIVLDIAKIIVNLIFISLR